jgi:hypothetical protein
MLLGKCGFWGHGYWRYHRLQLGMHPGQLVLLVEVREGSDPRFVSASLVDMLVVVVASEWSEYHLLIKMSLHKITSTIIRYVIISNVIEILTKVCFILR